MGASGASGTSGASGPLARARRRAGLDEPAGVLRGVTEAKPKPRGREAKEAEPPPPTADEAKMGERFKQRLRERQECVEEITALQTVVKKFDEWIGAALDAKGLPTVLHDKWRVTRSQGRAGSWKYKDELLLQHLDAKTLKSCKVQGKHGEPYVLVTEVKKKGG